MDKYPQLCDKPEKEGVPPVSNIYNHCQYCLKLSAYVRKIMNSTFSFYEKCINSFQFHGVFVKLGKCVRNFYTHQKRRERKLNTVSASVNTSNSTPQQTVSSITAGTSIIVPCMSIPPTTASTCSNTSTATTVLSGHLTSGSMTTTSLPEIKFTVNPCTFNNINKLKHWMYI